MHNMDNVYQPGAFEHSLEVLMDKCRDVEEKLRLLRTFLPEKPTPYDGLRNTSLVLGLIEKISATAAILQ